MGRGGGERWEGEGGGERRGEGGGEGVEGRGYGGEEGVGSVDKERQGNNIHAPDDFYNYSVFILHRRFATPFRKTRTLF